MTPLAMATALRDMAQDVLSDAVTHAAQRRQLDVVVIDVRAGLPVTGLREPAPNAPRTVAEMRLWLLDQETGVGLQRGGFLTFDHVRGSFTRPSAEELARSRSGAQLQAYLTAAETVLAEYFATR